MLTEKIIARDDDLLISSFSKVAFYRLAAYPVLS